MTSNFITPPDFVDDEQHTVTIIDASPVDVETLAILCSGNDESFNVYLYKYDLDNLEWLDAAVARSHVLIVNTEETTISSVKDRLAALPQAYYYGPKNFLANANKINNILDYFSQRANERQQHAADTL
jgi:hypothetical protein